MSLKGVELQIAIPKTFDAGKLADQHQQNVIHQQINANEALKRDIERKQFTVNESEGTDEITEEENRDAAGDNETMLEHRKKGKKQTDEPKAQHPFKGNFFDVSG